MGGTSIYDRIEEAKNGTKIPVFKNGRTMESRYNPERDAEKLCENITEGSFFIVIGIGSGIFIKTLYQKLLDNAAPLKIIAVENNESDLDFLSTLETVQELSKKPEIIFCHSANLSETLMQNYLPAKYGNLQIIEQRGWVNENKEAHTCINEILKKSLSIISADYSVQAHFGKIWIQNSTGFCRKKNSGNNCSRSFIRFHDKRVRKH